MTRRDVSTRRCLVGRPLDFERLEDRWVLSTFPSPSNVSWTNLMVESDLTARTGADFALIATEPSESTPGISDVDAVMPNSTLISASWNALAVEPNAAAPVLAVSSPVPPNTLSSPILSDTIATAGQAERSTLNSGTLIGVVDVASAGRLISPAETGANTGSGVEVRMASVPFGQASIAFYASEGEKVGETIPGSLAIFAGELTSQASTLSANVTPPGAVLFAAFTGEGFGNFARVSTYGINSLGATANVSNAAVAMGTGNGFLASCGFFKAGVSLGGFPLMDRAMPVTGGTIEQHTPSLNSTEPSSSAGRELPADDMSHAALFGSEIPLLAAAIPGPERFDLITNFIPFDEALVGQTLDSFLRQIEDVGTGLPWLDGSAVVVVDLMAAVAALVAWKVAAKLVVRSPSNELAAEDIITSFEAISCSPGGMRAEEP
jgi:hypothetical protein